MTCSKRHLPECVTQAEGFTQCEYDLQVIYHIMKIIDHKMKEINLTR